ncbi:hypothetical protein [Dyella sp. 2RAB6]|uniref:hypothetical protein n=1 Tax=Dyella sp. 2RAB6 TaxID=3232992 RepID=UPI003F8E122C
MSDRKNELVLAALRRAGKPSGSEELVDAVQGLALAEQWSPGHVADLNRRSIAKRLQNMASEGLVKQAGATTDDRARRSTPLFVPASGWDPQALVPPPPAGPDDGRPARGGYDGLNRAQLLAVLDADDELFGVFARHIQSLQGFFIDMQAAREKHRARLSAVGLEVR